MKFLPALAALTCVTATLTQAEEKPPTIYDETVITSSRIEMPLRHVATSMSVVSQEELQLKGYSSLADVLRTEASIAVSNSGGAGKTTSLRIRGEESYRTLVLIDGVDIADPTGTQIGPQMQHLLNSYDLERVEILRGPQGFMYGADAGGVVNIITRSGSEGFSGGLFAEAGGNSTQNLAGHVSGGNSVVDFSLAVSTFETDGFNSRETDTELQDDDGAENRTLHLKGGWNISETLRASVVLRDIDSDYEYDNCGYPTRHDCTGNTDQSNAKLSLDYLTESTKQSLSYATTDVERDTFTGDAQSFYTEGESSELEYLGSYQLAGEQTFIFGADYEEDEITATGSESDRDQLGLFAEYQVGFMDSLFFTAGLRHDDNSDFGRHNSVRVSAAYLVDLDSGSSLKFRSTYGTGFRAPSLSEIAYNAGPFAFGEAASTIFTEETSNGYDLGVEYLTANGVLLQATYFDQRIEDQIFFDLIDFSGYLQESGEVASDGIELSADVPLGDSFGLTMNYTHNNTESSTGATRSRRPEDLANLGISFSGVDDRLRVLANVRASRNAYNDIFGVGLVPLDDYEVLDLSASFRLMDSLELFARVQNLTDEEYVEVTSYNTEGRTAFAGVRFNF